MADDESPHDEKQLSYWHPTENLTSPLLLTVAVIGGVLAGFVAAGGLAIFCALTVSTVGSNSSGPVLLAAMGILLGLGAIACVIAVVRLAAREARKAQGVPRGGGRFFLIGFLIGFGLVGLLGGICFTAAGGS